MDVKTIAVFGATGKTGSVFTERAVKNYKVKALVRNPEKLKIKHPNLEVIQDDILNKNNVEKTIKDCQVVVTLIGQVKDSPEDLQTKSIQTIIKAMEKEGVKRLISLTGGGVLNKGEDRPKFIDRLIVFIMKNLAGKGSRNALLDAIQHAEIIKKSNLDWTIVRGPVLTENEPTGKYEVGYVGRIPGITLTRADLSDFILKIISTNDHIRDMPFLAYKK